MLGELLRLLLRRLHLRLLRLEVLVGVDEGLHVVAPCAEARDLHRLLLLLRVLGDAPAAERGVEIDEVLERQAEVDELFDLVDALPRHVPPDARPVVRHLVDPSVPVRVVARRGGLRAGRCATKPGVEAGQPVPGSCSCWGRRGSARMRHHELLIDERVSLEQVGGRGVVADHHLVDFRQAILVRSSRVARVPMP